MKSKLCTSILASLILAGAHPVLAADRHVPADYPTIQAAVNAAASGDTIHIAAGVYVEQVTIIQTDLTLIGQPGAILRAFPSMPQSLAAQGSSSSSLLGIALGNVVVSGLTLEGEHMADSQPNFMVGVYFFGGSGRVENCRITGFRGTTLGSGEAFGVSVVNNVGLGTDVLEVQVLRSTFADNQVSIDLGGDFTGQPSVHRTTFMVNHNQVIGNGPDDTEAQYGIWIEHGAGGEVKWNTISDHSYTGTSPGPSHGALAAFGIIANDSYSFGRGDPLAALQPVRYEGNVFRSNQWHFAALRADGSSLVNNSFDGTAPGVRQVGVAFSGENVVVATNRFSDMPVGILLLGDDPWISGNGLPTYYFGIASNATLTANGFCNVATNFLAEMPATYTEEDTQTCPFPNPKLMILSWPGIEDGFSVQSAPTPSGPWTTFDATPVRQNGQNSVVVPADANQQFFRLAKP